MKGIIDLTRVVGSVQINGHPFEVCAEAVADMTTSSTMTVQLRSYLHAEEQTHLMESSTPDWLPLPSTITEHVSHEEASAAARDIFASWCHKVQAALARHLESTAT